MIVTVHAFQSINLRLRRSHLVLPRRRWHLCRAVVMIMIMMIVSMATIIMVVRAIRAMDMPRMVVLLWFDPADCSATPIGAALYPRLLTLRARALRSSWSPC